MADNWQCQNCQAMNPPRKRKCWQCGTARPAKGEAESQLQAASAVSTQGRKSSHEPAAPSPAMNEPAGQATDLSPIASATPRISSRWKVSLNLKRRLPSINTTNRTIQIGSIGALLLACSAMCLCLLPFVVAGSQPTQGAAVTQPQETRPIAAAETPQLSAPTDTARPLLSATNTARPTATLRPTNSHQPSATTQPTDIPAATATLADDLALVVGVVDGDTIDVQLANGQTARLRYIGIDTPESGAVCGSDATAANRALVDGQQVRLEKDRSETDQFGRLLRYVYVGDVFVNAELVRLGYAESKRYPPDTAKANELDALEVQARAQNLICYAMGAFTPPTATVASTQPPAVGGGYVCANNSPCIKGNINSEGEHIYHFPGCDSYNRTEIDESKGERWFVTSTEAETAGWRRARNCP